MGKSIYLTGVEKKPGKSFVSLGLLSILKTHHEALNCFKLFEEDDDVSQIHLLEALSGDKITPLMNIQQAMQILEKNPSDLINLCVEKSFKPQTNDINFFEGSDFESENERFEYQFNLTIAQSLNCDVILVISANQRSIDDTLSVARSALKAAQRYHANIVGLIFNRVELSSESQMANLAANEFKNITYISVIPEFESLAQPSVSEIIPKLKAEVICGHKELDRAVKQFTVAAKTLTNFLETRLDRSGMLIITPDDRMDIVVGSLLADQSAHYPKIAGIVLTGGTPPQGVIADIIQGLESPFPVLLTKHKTYEAATILYSSHFHIASKDKDKLDLAIAKVRNYLNESVLMELLKGKPVSRITPPIFLYQLINKAKSDKKHIVLAEGEDPRILKAADHLLKREIVNISLIGSASKIKSQAKRQNLSLPQVKIIDINKVDKTQFANDYFELRKHKRVNEAIALERMSDPNYYAAMMVYQGIADGMVSGAIHTTADTVRPALEIIKTTIPNRLVSSVFIMCLATRVIIYGDCAINPNPSAQGLANIAYDAAQMASSLGIEPKVALLSYSSGSSGSGESVEKVKQAFEILTAKAPDLLVEGPIQYDAAVDITVAKKKMPDSKVAGLANVLIFPDLNTGNNTYKAVQRETGALAIGPVLLGLKKPVNDLSRGCSVEDVINTILITAIQAQQNN